MIPARKVYSLWPFFSIDSVLPSQFLTRHSFPKKPPDTMQMFNLVTLLSLQLSLTSALSIPGEKMKRSIVSDVVLYAYGQGATDWPLSYGLNDSEKILPTDYAFLPC